MAKIFGNLAPIEDEHESYKDGFQTGLNWDDAKHPWVPGGPFVQPCYLSPKVDDAWTAYCRQTVLNNESWLKGWKDGHDSRLKKE